MLCKRPTKTIELTVKEMDGLEFFIEEKLDGERMQLHKRGNEYFYCSRFAVTCDGSLTYRTTGKELTTPTCMENIKVSLKLHKVMPSSYTENHSNWKSYPQTCSSIRWTGRQVVYRHFKQATTLTDSYSAILDGEMLVWDEESGRTLPFGTLKTAALG